VKLSTLPRPACLAIIRAVSPTMRRPTGPEVVRFWASMEPITRPERDEPLGLDWETTVVLSSQH
jgi:hypothetical protein